MWVVLQMGFIYYFCRGKVGSGFEPCNKMRWIDVRNSAE